MSVDAVRDGGALPEEWAEERDDGVSGAFVLPLLSPPNELPRGQGGEQGDEKAQSAAKASGAAPSDARATAVDPTPPASEAIVTNEREIAEASATEAPSGGEAKAAKAPPPTPIQAAMLSVAHLTSLQGPSAAPAAGAASPEASVADVGSASAPQAASGASGIGGSVEMSAPSGSAIRLTVAHPRLGPIELELVLGGRDVEAQVTVHDARAKAAMRAGEAGLRVTLARGGMVLRGLDVRVDKRGKKNKRDGNEPEHGQESRR